MVEKNSYTVCTDNAYGKQLTFLNNVVNKLNIMSNCLLCFITSVKAKSAEKKNLQTYLTLGKKKNCRASDIGYLGSSDDYLLSVMWKR